MTVDSVTLDNATDLRLLKSVLVSDMPVGGSFLIDPNPARAFPKGRWDWAGRIRAEGARIKPGETYELLFKTRKNPGTVGSFRGVTVDYHDASHAYRRTDDRYGFMGVRDCVKADEAALATARGSPAPS